MTHGREMRSAVARAVTSLCRTQIHLHCYPPTAVYGCDERRTMLSGAGGRAPVGRGPGNPQPPNRRIVVDAAPEVHYNCSNSTTPDRRYIFRCAANGGAKTSVDRLAA